MPERFLRSAANLLSLLLFVNFLTVIEVNAQNLSPEDIIAKHLESIGTKEKRAAVRNRMAVGVSEFESKLPSRKTSGKIVIVSETNNNLMFLSSFNSKEYPFEKVGLFNEKVTLPFVTAGTRSPLGAFVNDHSKILSQGLFTGSVSQTWNLSNAAFKKEKFGAAGSKKLDGRKTYALNYFTGDSADFTVKMFFDAETFRHVRTEYRRVVAPQAEVFGSLGRQTGVKISLTETFGDFKEEVGGLTLPRSYRIQYVTDSNSGVYEYEWRISIAQYLFNQKLAADFFKFVEDK